MGKHKGYNPSGNPGDDRWLSPSNPHTGDGKTSRNIFDKVTAVFRKPSGQVIKPAPKKRK